MAAAWAGKGREDNDLSLVCRLGEGSERCQGRRAVAHIRVCSRWQSDGYTGLHKVGWGLSLWNKIAGGRVLEGGTGHRAQVHCGPVGVCVWLAAVGLEEAKNGRTEAGSRTEARAGRLRQRK